MKEALKVQNIIGCSWSGNSGMVIKIFPTNDKSVMMKFYLPVVEIKLDPHLSGKKLVPFNFEHIFSVPAYFSI